MNFIKIACVLFLGLSMQSIKAQQVLETETIVVDGYVKAEVKANDAELANLKQEIAKQKNEVVLNRQKAKSYQELSQSVEKLSETTEEYLLERKNAQMEIANYNAKVKCLQQETPGAECDKYIRRR